MQKKTAIVLTFVALFFAAVLQAAPLRGRVIDRTTREPLIGATILLSGTTRGTTSDASGEFQLELPRGEHSLEISYVSYLYIIDKVEDKSRVGVCIDTAHTLAAGYDIKTVEGFTETFRHFDEVIGFSYLRGMHINDSKKDLATRVDRHDSIGKGVMGLTTFKMLMDDPRFDNIPLILETPDESIWSEEIEYLYSI